MQVCLRDRGWGSRMELCSTFIQDVAEFRLWVKSTLTLLPWMVREGLVPGTTFGESAEIEESSVFGVCSVGGVGCVVCNVCVGCVHITFTKQP